MRPRATVLAYHIKITLKTGLTTVIVHTHSTINTNILQLI